jgi:hypothetical protein
MATMISFSITTMGAAHRHDGRAVDWPVDRLPVATYIECRTCGFEPAEQLSLPRGRCPKCYSNTWERLVRPGSLLRDAERCVLERRGRTEGAESAIDLAHRHGRAPL